MEESHGNDAAPNYGVVFPRDKVNEITITIAPEHWEAMWADTAEYLRSNVNGHAWAVIRDPMWVPATVEFEGNRWTNVGVRHKGWGTRWGAWAKDSLKMPLKLDFDQFEDEHPEIKNQRFYGFKQLSFANNIWDGSHLRDALTYDLLQDVGLVAAETANYVVTVDYGNGKRRLGLYTMIEVIDDTVIKRHFGDDSGNVYEGNGPAASLANGTFEQIRDGFQKKNNEKKADWSDIEALYSILHSGQRTTDPKGWRANLESVFDVNAFLKWLAIGALINHWDTYGLHPHNYYLYHNPSNGLLTWISWDHDLVLGEVGGIALDKKGVGAEWPLISFLLDDPTYYATYINYLRETLNGVLDPDKMENKLWEMARLVGSYAVQESSPQEYHTAVENLIRVVRGRAREADDFLAARNSLSPTRR